MFKKYEVYYKNYEKEDFVNFALNPGLYRFLHPFDFCCWSLREEKDKNAIENRATSDPDILCYRTMCYVILFYLNDDDILATTLKRKKLN